MTSTEPPDWQWKLQIERRLIWLEFALKDLRGKKTTDERADYRSWSPRDILIASAGIATVIGTLCEKTGLTGVGSAVLKAVAKAYGEK
ncbi:hypothetical protein [Hyphomicrobium sp. MC1]|uniref:hypothetical protein n=1 Tax=Hyphomicrobium sp. (strain MC1) TaxID=717785 RepID=UPI000213DCDC|nr:hypothetical protein [Hyphomicrobium sp. MC1]CCB64485.1 conserved protein of unknown function [Hyphomicrobium sp. MC1]